MKPPRAHRSQYYLAGLLTLLLGDAADVAHAQLFQSALPATTGGQVIAGGLALPAGGNGTFNINSTRGPYSIPWTAGSGSGYDAIAWFKRPHPQYAPAVPPGWVFAGGIIQDCTSRFQDYPLEGSFFLARIYDLAGKVIVDFRSPDPLPTWCSWQVPGAYPHDIWEQHKHPTGAQNPLTWPHELPAESPQACSAE